MLLGLGFLLIEIKYLTIALKLRAILYEVKDAYLYVKVKIALISQVLIILTGFLLLCLVNPHEMASLSNEKKEHQQRILRAGVSFNILPSVIELIILAGSFYIIIQADTTKTVSTNRLLYQISTFFLFSIVSVF